MDIDLDELLNFLPDIYIKWFRDQAPLSDDELAEREIKILELHGPFQAKQRKIVKKEMLEKNKLRIPSWIPFTNDKYETFEARRQSECFGQLIMSHALYNGSGHQQATILKLEFNRIAPDLHKSNDFLRMWHRKLPNDVNELAKACGKIDALKQLAGKSNGVAYLHQQETSQAPLIRMDNNQRELIFESLQKYFPDSEHSQLKLVLSDKPINHKLNFNSTGSIFIEFIRRLRYSNVISTENEEINKWIRFHFTSKGKIFKPGTVKQYLNGSRDVVATNRIARDIFSFRKKSSIR